VSAKSQIEAASADFSQTVGDAAWHIAWCAGSGVIGESRDSLNDESVLLECLLTQISHRFRGKRALKGTFFLASSAGGIYAGAEHPPFSEDSPARPTSEYGVMKLLQEELVRSFAAASRTSVLIGRITTLYGPGQNIRKRQGLISQVCLRALWRQPLILYVPLDIQRDYLYSVDAARIIASCLHRMQTASRRNGIGQLVIKNIASQRPVTVSTILAGVKKILKRPISIISGDPPGRVHHPVDLRVTSNVWRDIDQLPMTTLSEGIRSVVIDLSALIAKGDTRDLLTTLN
jgi:UDP-glucose 4-epimerase